MANGIGNAVGVRHTETSLIIWSGQQPNAQETTNLSRHDKEPITTVFGADMFYDAGNKGCAYGPMDEIAGLMRKMTSGQTLEIHATDISVASDLAAWCRLTGHELVDQRDTHFLIRHS